MGFDKAMSTSGGDGSAPNGDRKGAVGCIVAQLPNLTYQVELEKSRHVLLAHATGEAGGTKNFVRLLPGDRVEVDVSPHDLTRGRIVRKIQNESSRIGKEDL
jgi:translation initiation factor IF-1